MEDTLKTDIIDGQLVDWRKLSIEELEKMQEEAEKKEEEIMQEIESILAKNLEI